MVWFYPHWGNLHSMCMCSLFCHILIFFWTFFGVEILMLVPENISPPPLDPISVPWLRPWNLSDESEQFGGVRKSVHGTHLQWWAKQNKNIKDRNQKKTNFHCQIWPRTVSRPLAQETFRALQDVKAWKWVSVNSPWVEEGGEGEMIKAELSKSSSHSSSDFAWKYWSIKFCRLKVARKTDWIAKTLKSNTQLTKKGTLYS